MLRPFGGWIHRLPSVRPSPIGLLLLATILPGCSAADPVADATSCADLVAPMADVVNEFSGTGVAIPGLADIQVIAFLGDSMVPDGAEQLAAEVRDWEGVRVVNFFSQAEAVEEFKEMFADQPELIEIVENDPSILPVSLRVELDDASQLRAVSDRLRTTPGVFQVSASDDAVETLIRRLWFLQGSLRIRLAEILDAGSELGCHASDIVGEAEASGLVSHDTVSFWLIDAIKDGRITGLHVEP